MSQFPLFRAVVILIIAAVGVYVYTSWLSRPLALSRDDQGKTKRSHDRSSRVAQAWPEAATEEQVRATCAACHAYPPPDSFPRSAWREEVVQGYRFLNESNRDLKPPPLELVVAYYERRAPRMFPVPDHSVATGTSSGGWVARGYSVPTRPPHPSVINVSVVRLTNSEKPQILVCEANPLTQQGEVLLLNPHATPDEWKTLAKLSAPAHAEVVDLDSDGMQDIVVACLGDYYPTDDKVGSVVCLRGRSDGTFEPLTLLRDVGRIADVQAADFNADGKLDLLVAEFGWRKIGGILLLENDTVDGASLHFTPRVLDKRPGTIHVPVTDLNSDGKPDFIALISQEHETIAAFINENGDFRQETIYQAPHPAYGSSGIQLADMDSDGDLDVLYTNGDGFDEPFLVRPYHCVQWLENEGRFPFSHHRLARMPGVQRAVAGDVDGDGDQDVVAVSYLPPVVFPREEFDLDSVVLLEQIEKGEFVRHRLETKTCDHYTCALGDLFGDGRSCLVVGNFFTRTNIPIHAAVTIWSDRR